MEGMIISLYYQTYLKISYCLEFPLLPYKAILMDPPTFFFPARVTDTLYLQPVQRNTIGSIKSSCCKKKKKKLAPMGAFLFPALNPPWVRGKGPIVSFNEAGVPGIQILSGGEGLRGK